MSDVITRFDDLVDALGDPATDKRRLIAIVGAPGGGKSTLSEALAEALNQRDPGAASILPMDGFHLDDDVLRARGRLERKGAPDTFDVGGLVHMQRRLATNEEAEIAVPLFDRTHEVSRAGARIIPNSVKTVLVEGNYLLLAEPPWDQLAAFYDLTVQIDVSEEVLRARLVERWREHKLPEEVARRRIEDNDLPNARLVKAASRPADIVFREAATAFGATARSVG
ncbi:MAG: nucleoside/nucleotide kinase family protein [Rhizobiales bacterium]|nr:nucleoside/nucleotide kinase family protein [Hyphomicrobiales bacterium]MBO6699094.1 nucleoside/nucleotide kinase family protein [Hyphomicrobiales bacterium]MBO6736632.1 nucleoside/nucleotide kinase family protein [Hyphomicrobiales bacterium]MBO6912294.1 nucleoside/nucleotide kinase family protein [Hyphomicrobiales bacterium]MBO6956540.1 nucleoside/nucleotide kinase family protein [Hyphomicrobiales bacterium]